MIVLDDKAAILKTQGGDTVLKSVNYLPNQLQQAFDESQKISFPADYQNIQNIVVCGMGGSRFTPLIVKELFKKEIIIPYSINDDYILPGYVNKNSLVIVSSYSGTTEEPVFCGKEAFKQGLRVTGLTMGRDLIGFFNKNNIPFCQFDPTFNPSGQPRLGSGYMVGGHIGLLLKLGLLKIEPGIIGQAIKNLPSLLDAYRIDVPTEKNPAKQLANKLYQKYPYYVVSEFLTGVGNAVGNQTNETAKSISSFRVIPELNHHMMEGLKFPDAHRKMALFVLFFSKLYSAPIQKRFHITKEVVEQNKIETFWHELRGTNKVEQAFELMGLGSYMTMYLAALYGENPALIPYVDYFKKRLKEE